MVLGDFCVDPSGSIQNVYPEGTSLDIITYYTDCTGSNPLFVKASNASLLILELSTQLNDDLTALCGDSDVAIQTAINYLDVIDQDITSFDQYTASCDILNDYWDEGIHEGLCENLFNGLFVLWIGQYVVQSGIFLAMCLGSVLYLYYGRLWTVDPKDTDPYHPDFSQDEKPWCCVDQQTRELLERDEGFAAREVELPRVDSPVEVDASIVGNVADKPSAMSSNTVVASKVAIDDVDDAVVDTRLNVAEYGLVGQDERENPDNPNNNACWIA